MSDIMQYAPLWGAWHIESKIGEGSFGKVYKVRREEFGKIYYSAVKILTIPQNESDLRQIRGEGMDEASVRSYFHAFVADIVQEIELMNEFRGNSNIVSLEDHKVIEKTGEVGWDILIRMELLTSLSDYVTNKTPTQNEIIKLGIHICRALELCALKNAIHRDVKPENIFISQYGDFKLGDFGIARQIERTTSGLSKKGTYTYMAPEVFAGQEYGASVDIYSLGIVMYRYLNQNRTPFLPNFPAVIKPNDRDEALQKRMKGEPLPPLAGINPELNAIVMRACAYDRKSRYTSPTEMRKALEYVLGESSFEPVNTPIYGVTEQVKTDASVSPYRSYANRAGSNRDRSDETAGVFSESAKSSSFSPYRENTSRTDGVFNETPAKSISSSPYREQTSRTDGVYDTPPTNGSEYSPYRESTSRTDGVFTNRPYPSRQYASPTAAQEKPKSKTPLIILGFIIAVGLLFFVINTLSRNSNTVVDGNTNPSISDNSPSTNEPNTPIDNLPIDDPDEAPTSEPPTTTPDTPDVPKAAKVLLKDIDYFVSKNGSDGDFDNIGTVNDNLGVLRTNCLSGRNSTADLIYKINSEYNYIAGTLFQTQDGRNDAGAVLTIYGDGERLYSQAMHKGVEPIDFIVEIIGVNDLTVVFESEPDAPWWAFRGSAISELSLYPPGVEPTFATTADSGQSKKTLLNELSYFSSENGSDGVLLDKGTLKDNLGSIRYNCLTGFNSAVVLLYKINGKYSRLTGTLFMIEGNPVVNGGVTFRISGDGTTLFTAAVREGIEPVDFDVSLAGINELVIDYQPEPDAHWASIRSAALSDVTLYP